MDNFIEKIDNFIDDKMNNNPIKTYIIIGMVTALIIFLIVAFNLIILDLVCSISPILGILYLVVVIGGLIGLVVGIKNEK